MWKAAYRALWNNPMVAQIVSTSIRVWIAESLEVQVTHLLDPDSSPVTGGSQKTPCFGRKTKVCGSTVLPHCSCSSYPARIRPGAHGQLPWCLVFLLQLSCAPEGWVRTPGGMTPRATTVGLTGKACRHLGLADAYRLKWSHSVHRLQVQCSLQQMEIRNRLKLVSLWFFQPLYSHFSCVTSTGAHLLLFLCQFMHVPPSKAALLSLGKHNRMCEEGLVQRVAWRN